MYYLFKPEEWKQLLLQSVLVPLCQQDPSKLKSEPDQELIGGKILNSKGLDFVMLLKMYVRLHLANLVLWSNRIPRHSFC